MILLPKHRPPTSPGRLLERFLDDHELTQTRLAELAGMQLRRVNEILRNKRAVTPDTALRLARFFDTTPDLWINAQAAWDLWHVRDEAGPKIEAQVIPLAEARKGTAPARFVRPVRGRGAGATQFGSVMEFSRAARAPETEPWRAKRTGWGHAATKGARASQSGGGRRKSARGTVRLSRKKR